MSELEKEYRELLARLVKGAEYLSNPLITEEDYRKGMALYEQIDKRIEAIKERMKHDGEGLV